VRMAIDVSKLPLEERRKRYKRNEDSRRQNRPIKFRVDDYQYQELEKTADIFGLSVPMYAKKIVVDNAGKSLKYTDRQYKEINFHLLAIGRNLNQLVKTANYLRVQLNKKDTEIQKEEHQSVYLSFTTKQERLKRLYAEKNDLMIQIKSISDPLNRLEKELNELWARL
jgi:prefoldin subunit 5